MKSLVAFYSGTGTTKKVAAAIAESLKCDVEEVLPVKKKTGFLGFMSGGFEASFKKNPAIKDVSKNPDAYELIIIGTPVWVGTMASPIRTYLTKNKDNFKKFAFFCTCGSTASNTFKDMEAICSRPPIALLELKKEDVINDRHTAQVKNFCDVVAK